MSKATIGKTLEKVLQQKHMRVSELSRRTGITSSTIYSMIQRDSYNVNIDLLLKICKALDIEAQVFFDVYIKENNMDKEEESDPIDWDELKENVLELSDESKNDLLKYVEFLKWRDTQL